MLVFSINELIVLNFPQSDVKNSGSSTIFSLKHEEYYRNFTLFLLISLRCDESTVPHYPTYIITHLSLVLLLFPRPHLPFTLSSSPRPQPRPWSHRQDEENDRKPKAKTKHSRTTSFTIAESKNQASVRVKVKGDEWTTSQQSEGRN